MRPKVTKIKVWQYYLYGWWFYPMKDFVTYLAGPPRLPPMR